jgi:hypothetical protein
VSLRLKIEHGQDAGHIWRLKDPGLYIIGRDATSSIRVLDMKVSKGHCEIGLSNGTEGAAWIRDLKSTHGTQLNGQPLSKEATVKPGDEIRLGFTVLRLLSDGPADTIAAPNGPLPKAPPKPAATNGGAGGAVATTTAGPGPGANVTAPWAKDSLAGAGPAPGDAAKSVSKTLPPDELVGKTLGGYHVLRKIGQGGMGSVYVAEQVSLKREVALKVLSEKFVADSAFVDQFLNEARAAGQLNHPNVVQVYDVGKEQGRYFFSMEFVPGGAIEDRIKGAKSAEWSEALNWFLDATNALIFARKRGILHRDVKPDNLMLAEDGSAKLCDLGLAKKSESADLLAQGIIGTPHYLSPETIRRKNDIDHRTDLYSLGCTFYRILAGENPYPAKTVKDILLGHLNKPVPRVTDRKADVPKDLSDAVYKLMQKEPADRFENADDLYTALDKIRIQHGLAAHGIKPGSKKPLVVAVIVALLAALAVVYVVTRPKERETESAEAVAERLRREKALAEERQRLIAERADGFFTQALLDVERMKLDADSLDPEKTWNVAAAWAGWFKALGDLREKLATNPDYKDDPRMGDVLQKIDDLRAKIENDLAYHKQNATAIKAATEKYASDFVKSLEEYRQRYDAYLKSVEDPLALPWWKAAEMMTREAIEGLLKPFRERKFEAPGHAPRELMTEKELERRAREALPGPDRIGQSLYDQAISAGKEAHREAMERLIGKAQPDDPKALDAAAGELDKYFESMDAPDEQRVDEIAEQLRKQRRDVDVKRGKLREDALVLYERERAADRTTLHKLYYMLWEPRRGALAVFRWIPDDEVRRLVDTLRDPGYRRLGAECRADFAAFTKLFVNLKTAFDGKTWVDLNVECAGANAKAEKVTEVTAEGITCPAKTPKLWVDLGAPMLLTKVFYVKPGTPRFPFTTDDLRGLAVLAEYAADEEKARAHWQQYMAALTDEEAGVKADVALRLTTLAKSMEAARKWNKVNEVLRVAEGFGVDNKLPQSAQGASIAPDQREAILRERAALQAQVNEVGQMLSELHMDAALAATIWGAAIRSETHPRAAFAGEGIPAGVPQPNPLNVMPPPDPAAPAPQPPGVIPPGNPLPGGGQPGVPGGNKPPEPPIPR